MCSRETPTSLNRAADQSLAFRTEKVEQFLLSSACATLLPRYLVLTKHSTETFAKGQKHQRSSYSSGCFQCNISFINTICKCPLCRAARRRPTSQSLNKFLFSFKPAQTLSNVSGVIQGEVLCSLWVSRQRRTNVCHHRLSKTLGGNATVFTAELRPAASLLVSLSG